MCVANMCAVIVVSFLLMIVGDNCEAVQQSFAIEPVDRTAIVGDTIILPCRVINRAGTLQWTKDGFGLGNGRDLVGFPRFIMSGNDDEGDFSLQIRNVQLEDDSVYQCQVGPAEGVKGIRSRNAQVTVYMQPEPPKIVEGQVMRVTAGATVELTCEAEAGKPAAELTWLDGDGNPVTTGVEVTTQLLADGKRANTQAKWTLTASRDHDGKEFTCRSENPALKQPQRATIRMEVKYAPDVTLDVDRPLLNEGDDVRFSCSARANPETELVYKWYRNDEVIIGDSNTQLVLQAVTKDLNGATIACEVTNAVGTRRAEQVVNIRFGPTWKTPMPAVTGADLGQEVRLTCDVNGNPTAEITWLFENSPRVLSNQKELVIAEMSYDSVGRYLCRASVPGFVEINASTQLFIKGPPRVTSVPVQYGTEGEIIKVECLVQAVPPPTKITWSYNAAGDGQEWQSIEVDNSRGIELIEERLPTEIRNFLVIHKPRPDIFGLYNCSAWNEFGQDHMLITLSRQRNFPMLTVVSGIIGAVVLVVTVTIVIILCTKKKSRHLDEHDAGYTSSDTKKSTCSSGPQSIITTSSGKHFLYPPSSTTGGDTGSSGTESDLKVDIRASSSTASDAYESYDDQHHGHHLPAHHHHHHQLPPPTPSHWNGTAAGPPGSVPATLVTTSGPIGAATVTHSTAAAHIQSMADPYGTLRTSTAMAVDAGYGTLHVGPLTTDTNAGYGVLRTSAADPYGQFLGPIDATGYGQIPMPQVTRWPATMAADTSHYSVRPWPPATAAVWASTAEPVMPNRQTNV